MTGAVNRRYRHKLRCVPHCAIRHMQCGEGACQMHTPVLPDDPRDTAPFLVRFGKVGLSPPGEAGAPLETFSGAMKGKTLTAPREEIS